MVNSRRTRVVEQLVPDEDHGHVEGFSSGEADEHEKADQLVPRIAARTRAAAAGPPRRPTQAQGPENSGEKFDWKIPIKWILKICIGNPPIKF